LLKNKEGCLVLSLEDVISSTKRLKALAKQETLKYPEGSDEYKAAKIRHGMYSSWVDRLESGEEALVDIIEEAQKMYNELLEKQVLTIEDKARKEALYEFLLINGIKLD